jgi:hypothetical protein
LVRVSILIAVFYKIVIPAPASIMLGQAAAGIQSFQEPLDAPVSSTGQAPQVRHDEKGR